VKRHRAPGTNCNVTHSSDAPAPKQPPHPEHLDPAPAAARHWGRFYSDEAKSLAGGRQAELVRHTYGRKIGFPAQFGNRVESLPETAFVTFRD
jgi:hypothetical protein